ncbi:G-patch domain-containing protein [Apiospora phragmitis]|uniref:Protein SQS1 n=1 Tax=Apiospora phragmitis TaxID=2905665 RepID=A0ABR1VGZ7_9PEZI
MARRKPPKKSTQAPPGQGPSSGPRGRGPRRDPLLDVIQSSTPVFRGPHTLADEARSTAQRRRGGPAQDGKLRYNPVKFVSAGYMNPSDELKVLQDEDKQIAPAEVTPVDSNAAEAHVPDDTMAIDVHPDDARNDVNVDVDADDVAPNPDTTAADAHPSAAPSPPLFVIDTAGDKTLRQKYTRVPIQIQDESVHSSVHDSDSSEEVILFKGRNPSRHSTAPATRSTNTPKPDSDFMQLGQMNTEIKVVEETMQAAAHKASLLSADVDVYKTTVTEQPPANKEIVDDQRFENLLSGTHSDEKAAMIADYIANMGENEEDDDDELDQHPGLASHAFHLLRDIGGTDSDGLPEGLLCEDSIDESGEQPNGSDGPDAQRAASQGQDERLARMLAKQEQVGLGGGEIFLYDGTGSGDDDGDDDGDEWNIAPKTTPRRKKKGSSKTAKIIQKKGQFPSASKMAEAFDELDLMDWHRPSLHNYNKRSQVPYVSDSELEEAMNASSQKDRLKKADKKKQREALRAQGLLGKSVNPEDSRIKYPGGMTKDDLVYELEQFILGDDEQLSLPPLDKHSRRCIHQVASKLKIKSQSAGKGVGRYPVLYRTKGTVSYDERGFTSATRYLRQSYYPRVDIDEEVVKEYKALRRKDPNVKRGHAATSYREGEVVGQHASELASDNKGRMLLEKMGWSKGMALGTTDNKGIMVPIVHVVKKTKAGLGES